MLVTVFLHAEFISAMKTVQNPTTFMKYAKKQKKKKTELWIILVISVISKFFEIFTETLEKNIRKSQKIWFLDGKEDK